MTCSDKNFFIPTTAEEHHVLSLMNEVNVLNSHVPGFSATHVNMRNKIQALILTKVCQHSTSLSIWQTSTIL